MKRITKKEALQEGFEIGEKFAVHPETGVSAVLYTQLEEEMMTMLNDCFERLVCRKEFELLEFSGRIANFMHACDEGLGVDYLSGL